MAEAVVDKNVTRMDEAEIISLETPLTTLANISMILSQPTL